MGRRSAPWRRVARAAPITAPITASTAASMVEDQVVLDFERPGRIGFDEAILCAGKSAAQLELILHQAAARGVSFLLTRLDPAQHAALPERHLADLDYDPLSRTGYFAWRAPPPLGCKVALVSAGSADAPVAAEAARTLRYYGAPVVQIQDVGVAGLWRLQARLAEIRVCPVIIVVAGMDGALPSVVAGQVPGLVIAVPTSTGYGVARGGETALHAALCSCAPGLVVTNIDNGYGAACAALRSARNRVADAPQVRADAAESSADAPPCDSKRSPS